MKSTNVVKILQGGAMAACVALLLGWAALPGYSQYSCAPSSSVSVWDVSGTGDWNVAGNWNPASVPNSSSTSACILNGTASTPTTVTVGASKTEAIANLTLNTNNALDISTNADLIIANGAVSNAGTIGIAGATTGLAGTLFVRGGLTLQGSGTVNMTGGIIDWGAGGDTFTHLDSTIQGSGLLELNGSPLVIVNDAGGTVDANAVGQSLEFFAGVVGTGLTTTVTNNGTFEAKAGSTLVVDGPITLSNLSNGTLTGGTWDANGTIQLSPLGTTGGEITTNDANIILDDANGGAAKIVDANGSNTLSALANNEGTLTLENGGQEFSSSANLANSGTINIGAHSVLGITNSTVSNAGTIDIAGTLFVRGGLTLQGPGTVNMTGGNIEWGAGGATVSHLDSTIQGSGLLALDGSPLVIVNDAGGTVDANVAGQSLEFFAGVAGTGITTTVTNNGTFEAAAGSTLRVDPDITLSNFSNGTLTGGTWNANGTIQLSPLGTTGGEITTNDANIILDGANGGAAKIVDANGLDALSALANNEGTLTVENGASETSSANLTNSGTINIGAGSTLALTGGYSQTVLGSTSVNGTLQLEGGLVQLGFGSLAPSSTGVVGYSNGATVVGGFLMSSGEHIVGSDGASFRGTTIDSGDTFLAEGPTSFTNVTNSSSMTVNGGETLTWNGGSNADSGSLNVGDGATANVSSFTSSGVMTVTGTGVVANSGANLTLGGGSRTYIGSKATPGGTLSTVAGTTIELNGSLLDNNGTVSGTLDVNYGSLAEGAGVYGAVNVTNGGAFHPGNSPGIATSSSATWGAGGAYQFSINSATGTAGTNWSRWNVTGNLDVTAGTTTNSQFTIDISSLLTNDSPGLLPDFNPADPYTWLIASAGSVTGFNPADFAFDTSGFANALDGGTFSLADGPTDINLIFTPESPAPTPTPESSTMVQLGPSLLGLLAFGWWAERRKQRSLS